MPRSAIETQRELAQNIVAGIESQCQIAATLIEETRRQAAAERESLAHQVS